MEHLSAGVDPCVRQQDWFWLSYLLPRWLVTWSLLLPSAPGFFFFLIWQGDVSADEWPFDECDGLGIFLFWAPPRSLGPESESAGKGQRLHRRASRGERLMAEVTEHIYKCKCHIHNSQCVLASGPCGDLHFLCLSLSFRSVLCHTMKN